MERTIYKYKIEIDDKIIIKMPDGAEILSVQTQHGGPCMWVLVDPEAEMVERVFRMVGTGHTLHYDIGTRYNFIGTFQMQSGFLVFHVFEML